MPTKLEATYSRFTTKLARLQRELESCTRRLAQLQDEILKTTVAISALREAGAGKSKSDRAQTSTGPIRQPNVAASTPEPGSRFGDLTRRVDEIVNSLKPGEQLRRTEISDRLHEQGFGPSGAHARTTLFSTLQRLRKQGRIGAQMAQGEWFFFPKDGSP